MFLADPYITPSPHPIQRTLCCVHACVHPCVAQHVPAALAWLSSQPLVLWLEPRLPVAPSDLYANIITQAGTLSADAAAAPARPSASPLWARGLDGSGQVRGGRCDRLARRRSCRGGAGEGRVRCR